MFAWTLNTKPVSRGSSGVTGRGLAGWGWDLSTSYGVNRQKQSSKNNLNPSLGTASPTRFDLQTNQFTQWTTNLDLNIAYKPSWAEGLQFKVDVFNVLNSRKPASYNEVGEDAAGSPIPQAASFMTPTSYQTPRQVRFMVQYDF